MTPLDKSLKRALKIDGRDYVITLTPDAPKITQKGHRLGVELKWPDLVSGESALTHRITGKRTAKAFALSSPIDRTLTSSTSAARWSRIINPCRIGIRQHRTLFTSVLT